MKFSYLLQMVRSFAFSNIFDIMVIIAPGMKKILYTATFNHTKIHDWKLWIKTFKMPGICLKTWRLLQKCMAFRLDLRPGICVKYFLSFPQKKCHQRKVRQTKCLLFNFWMIKLIKTPILSNCQVPNGFFGILR